MGRLGGSNTNTNTNTNTTAGPEVGFWTRVRFNSQEFRKVLNLRQFPAEPDPTSPAAIAAYDGVQATVNKLKFRKYWDAELRASVYLNEFLSRHPHWLPDMVTAIRKRGYYDELKRNKGEQLRRIIDASDEREERFAEIIDQHEGEGALKYWVGMLMIDAASAPATYQLIRVGRRVGEIVVMCLKEKFGVARPSQACPAVVPLIDPPVTPSFPSGHALQGHLISKCLEAAGRAGNQAEMLFDLSRRIALNRVIAGLHYPLDNDAGVFAAEETFRLLQGGQKFEALVRDAEGEADRQLSAIEPVDDPEV